MKKEYDFSESIKNPYAKKLKEQVTIRLESDTIKYFKNMASDTGMPYQNIIGFYLRDCLTSGRRLKFG